MFGCWHSLWFVFSAALTHYLSLRNTLTDDQNRPIKPFYFHDGTRFKCGSTDQNPWHTPADAYERGGHCETTRLDARKSESCSDGSGFSTNEPASRVES